MASPKFHAEAEGMPGLLLIFDLRVRASIPDGHSLLIPEQSWRDLSRGRGWSIGRGLNISLYLTLLSQAATDTVGVILC